MEKELHRQQHIQAQRHKHAAASVSVPSQHCHNCGAPVHPGASFCEECGAPCSACCMNCGAAVSSDTAICPSCGKPATTLCTYCGSPVNAGDAFCSECGNPRGGIVCPRCDTLNYRNFCRKCNHPLNPMALYAVEEAERDPKFIKAKNIAREIDELENEISALETLLAGRDTAPSEPEKLLVIDDTTSDAARRLLDEFADLSGRASSPRAVVSESRVDKPAAPALTLGTPDGAATSDFTIDRSHTTFGAAAARLEKLREQYAAKTAELQRALDDMVPDEAAPPEIKRNFACARKITAYTTATRREKERVCWICNRCQVRHANPSECAVAEYGGRWEVREVVHKYEVKTTRSINL